MIRFSLSVATALLIANAAAAGTLSVTGQNGGSATSIRTCAPAGGSATCTRDTVTTAPNGATGSRHRVTTATRDGATSILSGTRPGGRSFGRTATRSR